VRNGLCLSRLHDAAFDQGLITFDDDLKLTLSASIRDVLENKAAGDCFGAYEGHPLQLPEDAALHNPTFLRHHRKTIFRS
jgi:putative restriction endonuclease